MLTSTANERQLRTMCAYKEGESIPSVTLSNSDASPLTSTEVER